MCEFAKNEKLTSQIPALQLLVAMGHEYISPEEALAETCWSWSLKRSQEL